MFDICKVLLIGEVDVVIIVSMLDDVVLMEEILFYE